jgi:hypothetical protein
VRFLPWVDSLLGPSFRNIPPPRSSRLLLEVRDLADSFNDALHALSRRRDAVEEAALSTELLMAQCALDLQQWEDSLAREHALDDVMTVLLEREEEAAKAQAAFRAAVEAAEAALRALRAEDDALDRGFRERLKAACGAIDSDVLRVAVALFRRRPTGSCGDVPLLTRRDCPEGYGTMADDAVMWPALNALRSEKLASEAAVRAAEASHASMLVRLRHLTAATDAIRTQLDAHNAEREGLAASRQARMEDPPLLLRLHMGQDEVVTGGSSESRGSSAAAALLLPDYGDAQLVRRSSAIWREIRRNLTRWRIMGLLRLRYANQQHVVATPSTQPCRCRSPPSRTSTPWCGGWETSASRCCPARATTADSCA